MFAVDKNELQVQIINVYYKATSNPKVLEGNGEPVEKKTREQTKQENKHSDGRDFVGKGGINRFLFVFHFIQFMFHFR